MVSDVYKRQDHLCHLEQGLTAKRFVAQRPDQNSRMVFITLVSGIHAVKKDSFPLRLIIGDVYKRQCQLFRQLGSKVTL